MRSGPTPQNRRFPPGLPLKPTTPAFCRVGAQYRVRPGRLQRLLDLRDYLDQAQHQPHHHRYRVLLRQRDRGTEVRRNNGGCLPTWKATRPPTPRRCYNRPLPMWPTTPAGSPPAAPGRSRTTPPMAAAAILVSGVTSAQASHVFSGRRIKLAVSTYWSCGVAKILIDGVDYGTCNLNSATMAWNVKIFTASGLAKGNHTLCHPGHRHGRQRRPPFRQRTEHRSQVAFQTVIFNRQAGAYKREARACPVLRHFSSLERKRSEYRTDVQRQLDWSG